MRVPAAKNSRRMRKASTARHLGARTRGGAPRREPSGPMVTRAEPGRAGTNYEASSQTHDGVGEGGRQPSGMTLDALWHDLECGAYREDLALWHTLAGVTGGPVLDVGAGTGRVSLDLAARGVA